MRVFRLSCLFFFLMVISFGTLSAATQAVYVLENKANSPDNLVKQLTLEFSEPTTINGQSGKWCSFQGVKVNGQKFQIWVLGKEFFPKTLKDADSTLLRYIFQEGDDTPSEYVHALTGKPIFPTIGGWEYIFPRPESGGTIDAQELPKMVLWLGHTFVLDKVNNSAGFSEPGEVRTFRLRPDALIGVPSNSRTKDDTRRYDGSDYEMVRLTQENYEEMIQKGLTCLRVDAEQLEWIKDKPVYYWGVGVHEMPFPEMLYRSTYIGPTLFFDEPGVCTRDYDIRPRLEKEPEFRRELTVQIILDEFKKHYQKSIFDGPPTVFMKGLQARKDIDLGTMKLHQTNLYVWETLVAGSAWELLYESALGPRAFVFEPPGRIGSRRTIPEFNMVYGCQLSPTNPAHFLDMLCGFMRGAARASGKEWGISVYGAVDRADAPWWLTHAYDLGATHFFFWDNYQSACVPYSEYLALTQRLQAHIKEHPKRNLARLKHLGEAVILLPPGYDLGHTHTGRGNLWGLGELNLERKNPFGVKYRTVMSNFFIEMERCFRLGIPFDILWDIEGLDLKGYNEIVRVREDGMVEVTADGKTELLTGPRIPEREKGKGPTLNVSLAPSSERSNRGWTARVEVGEGDAPIYYTPGTNRQGEYANVMVLWELYGPNDEDCRQLSGMVLEEPNSDGIATVESRFTVPQPGQYRLRIATCDMTGRTAVVWKEFNVEP